MGPPLSTLILDMWKQVMSDYTGGGLRERLIELALTCPGFDPDKLLRARNFKEWDEASAPAYGFASTKEMFAACDVVQVGLWGYRVPSLLINASNDIITPPTRFTTDDYKQPHLALVTLSGGGHLGYVDGNYSSKEIGAHASWIRNVAFEFVEATGC